MMFCKDTSCYYHKMVSHSRPNVDSYCAYKADQSKIFQNRATCDTCFALSQYPRRGVNFLYIRQGSIWTNSGTVLLRYHACYDPLGIPDQKGFFCNHDLCQWKWNGKITDISKFYNATNEKFAIRISLYKMISVYKYICLQDIKSYKSS